jgi:hypothetical protein
LRKTATIGTKVILIIIREVDSAVIAAAATATRETIEGWVVVEAIGAVKRVECRVAARLALNALKHHIKDSAKVGRRPRTAKISSTSVLVQNAIGYICNVPIHNIIY